jgi:hypothetical protein
MDFSTLISKLFEARQVAHNAHLATRSYAAHKAMNEFYDGILEIADELAEVIQGEFGLLDVNIQSIPVNVDFVVYLKELCAMLKASGQMIPGVQSYHLNIIDNAIALSYKTAYLLTLS